MLIFLGWLPLSALLACLLAGHEFRVGSGGGDLQLADAVCGPERERENGDTAFVQHEPQAVLDAGEM